MLNIYGNIKDLPFPKDGLIYMVEEYKNKFDSIDDLLNFIEYIKSYSYDGKYVIFIQKKDKKYKEISFRSRKKFQWHVIDILKSDMDVAEKYKNLLDIYLSDIYTIHEDGTIVSLDYMEIKFNNDIRNYDTGLSLYSLTHPKIKFKRGDIIIHEDIFNNKYLLDNRYIYYIMEYNGNPIVNPDSFNIDAEDYRSYDVFSINIDDYKISGYNEFGNYAITDFNYCNILNKNDINKLDPTVLKIIKFLNDLELPLTEFETAEDIIAYLNSKYYKGG